MTKLQSFLVPAAVIRDATEEGENTALRVGTLFVNLIQSLVDAMPDWLIDATGIVVECNEKEAKISFDARHYEGNTVKQEVKIPAATAENAGLFTPAERNKLNNSISQWASEWNARITEISARMDGIEGEANLAKTGADSANAIINNELRPAVQDMRTKVDQNTTDITAFNTLIEENKELFEEFKGNEFSQLCVQVDKNTSDIVEKANSTEVEDIQTRTKALETGSDEMRADLDTHRAEIDDLRSNAEQESEWTAQRFAGIDSSIQRASEDILSLKAKHTQFNLNGYYDSKGAVVDALLNGKEYVRTGLIPIERNNAITVNTAGDAKTAQLVFFDAQGQVLKVASLNSEPVDGHFKVTQVAATAIPDKAVYFATCTTLELKNSSSYSNGDTVEAQSCAVSDVVQRSKKLLFIDQWTSLGNLYAGLTTEYDVATDKFLLHWNYSNEETKKYEPKVTYEQAMAMVAGIQNSVLGYSSFSITAPANLPPIGYQSGSGPYLSVQQSEIAQYNPSLEVLILATQTNGFFKVYQNPIRLIDLLSLKAVIGVANTESAWNPLSFVKGGGSGFPKLEFFRVLIKQSFDVRTSPLLTLDTMQYLVTYAQNTTPITVTVHPDVYAKISGPDEDTPGGVRSYLPLNLADGNISNKSPNVALIDNGVEITRQNMDVMFRMTLGRTIPIVKGKKYTLSMDVEGMAEGDNYYLLINELAGGATNAAGVINLYNGRPTAVFTAQKDTKVSELTFDDFDRTGLDKDATSKIKITNIRLSAGEYEALPYVAPPSKIEDEQLREQVYWASLLDEAALKNITFATTQ